MKLNHLKLLFIALLAIGFLSCSESKKETRSGILYKEFQNPPNSACPRVWWHWMNGNVNKDGIRKDLEWMQKSGIGGFQNFDAGLATPQVVEKRVTFMTPEWKDAFAFTTHLADSLGMEMTIAASPGWSQTGGPWVEPKDGMKKLVWRELRVEGGRLFNDNVPEPFKTTGNFQNVPMVGEEAVFTEAEEAPDEYYEDIAVVAFRLQDKDVILADLNPKITSSGGNFTLKQLTDGDFSYATLLPRDNRKGYAWIQYEFEKAQTIKAISVASDEIKGQWEALPPTNNKSLEISRDGKSFERICYIPTGGVEQQTITIPETTAKYFRITFNNPVPTNYSELMGGSNVPAAGSMVAEIVLHPVTKINHAEEKAGFAAVYDLERYPTPETNTPISGNDIIDLTDKFEDGKLNWQIPSGKWKILRFGYSLTGKKNHPASPEATGLEVDKLDARAVRDYFNNYLDQYKDATGGLMGKRGLQYIIIDSYEAGQMTWTPKMAEEFEARRGYSLIPWLPVLAGEIIESTKASEQFLWDWRTTIGELIAENSYDQVTDILAERGMGRYTESHENGRLYLVDGMDAKRTAAVPMSAMWTPSGWGSTPAMAQADIRESASVAHIYGQNLVAAESMTAFGLGGHAWSYCPENLKPVADLELANGLNRFVIHTSVHQPVDDKIPGLGLFVFGQWFTRHETWADQAKSWTDYLARSSYMLQQGKFVADIVYYYGEDNNITGLFGHEMPEIPQGYNLDFINPHALINLLEVDNGNLVTPSGMTYRMLVLDENTRRMSLSVLRKLAQLANDGAIIVGTRPEFKAGMQGEQDEFDRLVKETWDSGKSNIYENKTIQQVLHSLNLNPDFTYTSENDVEVLNVHRKVGDTDIFWVNSRSDQPELIETTFRVSGKKPEVWHPDTGEKSDVSYSIKDGTTTVLLDLKPNDAVFVVFGQSTKENKVELPKKEEKEIGTVDGSWNVAFQPERGAPESAVFNELSSFTENQDEGIKYFSGTATYSKTIQLSDADIAVGELLLDLGEVKNLAEVSVNGQTLGVLWKKPFKVNITKAVKPGENKLEIKVVNLWVNRLIGDAQPDITEKITYTTMPFYQADSPLKSSGLLGPVKVLSYD
ncbi:glycosyl hydrolase [uncultured Draconibacterium sp.]|uniref:glycosyl hydrolase n=1 Tax=uncultured Draconibacterium sp. TaxID=1573823 RepID=UPI002AA68BD6|nr:glycosyl hydrolase [uncultured Draconibacterium sp.]